MTAVLPIVPVMNSSYKNTILYIVYIMVLHVLSFKEVVTILVIRTYTTTINEDDHKIFTD